MKKDKSSFVNNMGEIYKDIKSIEIDANASLQSHVDKFYKVMRKWGICQGNWTEGGGRSISTPEWCMCFMVFKDHFKAKFDFYFILSTPPKDLLAYGKRPSKKKSKKTI
jgi:hypothetical protein